MILNQLLELAVDPYTTVAQIKQRTGKKVIGCYPMDIPEELIAAAGLYPVVIWIGNEPVTLGYGHTMPFNCAMMRTLVDDVLKGKLWFLDGLVMHRMCLPTHELMFVLERYAKWSYLEYLYLPAIFLGKETYQATYRFTIRELERFKSSLEDFIGRKIQEDDLIQAIKIYNRDRGLLRQLYQMRHRLGIRAWELCSIVQSSMIMPKDEHAQLLEKLIQELQTRQVQPREGPKVVLVGCMCQLPRLDVLRMIEDLGMIVVADDLYVGYRYIANDVSLDKDPISALADRYFAKIPPTLTKADWETHWGEYIADLVSKSNADGVISLMPKFCPPHLCYYPVFKRYLMEHGIPEVLIELEHEAVTLETIRTKLQAFRELLGK